jgi:hypothetical protein
MVNSSNASGPVGKNRWADAMRLGAVAYLLKYVTVNGGVISEV